MDTMTSARTLVLAACLGLLAACASEPASPPPPVPADGGMRMPVVGVDGWQFSRVLRFGDYATSKVGSSRPGLSTQSCLPDCPAVVTVGSTGHTPLYRRQFDTAFTSAASKLEFEQHAADGQSASVRAIYEAQRRSNLSMTEWMGFPIVHGSAEVTASFSGTVTPAAAGRSGWHFVLQSDSAVDDLQTPAGWAVDDDGHRLVIRHAPLPAGYPSFVAKLSHGIGPGYRFESEGQLIASYDEFPSRSVWMRDGLAPDLRLALAGLSSALMLQPR
jgi:hypothetical protein